MNFIAYLGELTLFFFRVLYWSLKSPYKFSRVIRDIYAVGVESLPLVSVVAFSTGIILAIQSAYQLQKISSEIYIANLVSLSLCRELGPVLTALIVAGRVGSSLAAQIGTMKITEQVDALKTLATSPIKYIVVPKFLALTVSLPLLVIWANFLGILGGFIVCVYKLGINPYTYLRMSFDALIFKDYFTGLFKAFIFAIVITTVSSFQGFSTGKGAEAVGKTTTRAVVSSFLFIIGLDCLITFVFFFIL